MARKQKKERASVRRAKLVETLIRQVYTSLESHLEWTYKPVKNVQLAGSTKFQRQCVKEYAGIILLLTDLY